MGSEDCMWPVQHSFSLFSHAVTQTVSCLVETDSVSGWFTTNAWALVLLVVVIGFTIMVVGLCGLHSYLAVSAQTTWEMMSRAKISYLKDYPRWVRLVASLSLFAI